MKLAAFHRLQDESATSSSEEQLLYQNLCILGLAGVGSKQVFASELTRSSFRKCNTKALEYVLYHLHGVLKGRARSQKVWGSLLNKLFRTGWHQQGIHLSTIEV